MSWLATNRKVLFLILLLLWTTWTAHAQSNVNTTGLSKSLIPISSFASTKQKADQMVAKTKPEYQKLLLKKRKPNLLINSRTSGVQDCAAAACIVSSAPLPVTLIEFTAERLDPYHVQLIWTTSQEVNNDHFELERTLNPATGFWVVGNVKGKVNSSQNVTYQLKDPNEETSYTYYRLKQVDTDGSISYSRIVGVIGSSQELSVFAFPNPGSGQQIGFKILGYKSGEPISVQVYDIKGRNIFQKDGYFPSENQPISLPNNQIPEGSYIIKIKSPQQQATASFMVTP